MIERLRVRILAEAAGEFSSPESALCAESYSVSVPPPCTAVARKRPLSSCEKYRWQITPKHTYTLDPAKSEWADCAAVQALCGKLSGNELTRNLSGNIQPQSTRLAEPLWTDPGIKSGISVRELILPRTKNKTKQKIKKAQTGNEWSSILPKSSQAGKKPPARPVADRFCLVTVLLSL